MGRTKYKRDKREVRVTGMMMMVTRNPMKGLPWVPEITVLLFSLRIGPSTSFYL